MTTTTLNHAKVEAFAERAVGDYSATMTVALCHVGDRLGLFKDLNENGPATARVAGAIRRDLDL